MFQKIFDWFKHNFLVVIIFLVILFASHLNPRSVSKDYYSVSERSYGYGSSSTGIANSIADGVSSPSKAMSSIVTPTEEIAPTAQTNRIVIENTYLSLVVKDVSNALLAIKTKTEELGGFLVSSNLNRPEESASGEIIVRVPSEKLTEVITAFKGLAVKTVSEQVTGTDVTDQYVDIEQKLDVLQQTQTKFQTLFDKAVLIDDMLRIQRELLSLQSQVDQLKGQQQYLEKSASYAKITIYLSSDEFSLPYAPSESWRPEVIFKQAVRSLVSSLRGLASKLIWIIVYLPIWLPIILVIMFFARRKKPVIK